MSEPSLQAVIELPAHPRMVGMIRAFSREICAQVPVDSETSTQIESGLDVLARFLVHHQTASDLKGLQLTASWNADVLSYSLWNKGLPVLRDRLGASSVPGATEIEHMLRMAAKAELPLTLTNKGRDGQVFELTCSISKATSLCPERYASGQPLQEVHSDEVIFRPLMLGEEAQLSELFYRVYQYNYVDERVYHPETFRERISSGELKCYVASLVCGRIAGQIALRRSASEAVSYEMCLGLTDPTLKAKKLFGNLFQYVAERALELPMDYLFFDSVTNHDFSQRYTTRRGAIDTALLVGCQSKTTQARLARLGLGADPDGMDRYSLLYSLIDRKGHVFGKTVVLPDAIGQRLGFLIESLGLDWIPPSRADVLVPLGSYTQERILVQKAVYFDLLQTGKKATLDLISDWRSLLRDGYEYAAVDIPLTQSGVSVLHEILSENGFFLSGFLPYKNGNTLALRMQALAPRRVAFEHIRVHSPIAKQLLRVVHDDYERTKLL